MSRVQVIILFLIFGVSCVLNRQEKREVNYINNNPPGTIKYSNNKFVDKGEITNFNWCEYMYYVYLAYGPSSSEYKSTLPDTNCWSVDANHNDFVRYYFRHPAYRDYPVVGISYEQAAAFTQWRSDRVMEYVLVEYGIIPFHRATNRDSVFTIESYFKGQYLNYKPHEDFQYYPKYSLPDIDEWQKINSYGDSINTINRKSCKQHYCGKDALKINSFEGNISRLTNGDVTSPAFCYECKKILVYHLKGNVREISSSKGISFGGGWKDSLKIIQTRDTFFTEKPNSYTGFRNICQWVKWE